MDNINRLSHSAITTYMSCGEKFRLHYSERLRGTKISSALLFGTAIDKALAELVNTRDLDKARTVFKSVWGEQEINGVKVSIPNSPDIQYSQKDTDGELLEETPGLTDQSQNDLAWRSLQAKGLLMLEAVNEQILPRLKKIHSTQEQINLTNDQGDSIIGFVDLVADWDNEGNTVVFDFKTASRAYEEDSVITSPQLSLYMHDLSDKYNTRKAGFIVLNKNIQKNRKKICKECGNDGSATRHKTCAAEIDSKRCGGEFVETINPKATIDVIIDEIPEATETLIIDNADRVNKLVKEKIYVKNLSTCKNDYGRPCLYFNLCYRNDSTGLIKLENKDEKK